MEPRFCEFARAAVEICLAEPASPVRYIGFVKSGDGERGSVKDALSEISAAVRSKAYKHWDGSLDAPPPTRQRQEPGAAKPPSLQVLAWQDGVACFPDVLLDRFPDGCDERKQIEDKKAEFEVAFPKPPPATVLPNTGGPSRVGGVCDFSIGKEPLDVERLVQLSYVKDADFTEERHGKHGKPFNLDF